MSKQNLYFIPKVKNLRRGAGFLNISSIESIYIPLDNSYHRETASYLQKRILSITGIKIPIIAGTKSGVCIELLFDGDAAKNSERYSLEVSADGVALKGTGTEGVFRAGATFIQLILNCPSSLPYLEINDEPDFAVRGFYHDVTRGRVPTLDTLKHLADILSFYKINHFQLYIEHTFAFKAIPELHAGKDPLSADDILELDRYCRDRYIDLVPSLSTFGHLYELLRLPRFEHLNELDIKASQTPRSLWDRMAHYTLDVSNDESFYLVKGMIEEYLPLFSSPYFNICCDETFDLGTGKNAERAQKEGTGRLYVDFVKKIMSVVRRHGKKPMLWGDIVLKHPELISELAGDDTIFLNWEYTPEVTCLPIKTFKDAGVNQYVCPGVNGWSRFAADVNRGSTNILKMVRFGRDAGALGVLNTDWGDCGQVNLLSTSFHSLAFGAALSWNSNDGDDKSEFDKRFSFLQWGLEDGRLGEILRELGELSAYHFGNLYAWVTDKQCLWFKEDDIKAADPIDLGRRMNRALEFVKELKSLSTQVTGSICGKAEFDEYLWSAEATAWLLSVQLFKKRYEYNQKFDEPLIPPDNIIKDGYKLTGQFKHLWRLRNRESELRDAADTFLSVISRIEKRNDSCMI
ncbi:MAG: family 20 glycosylhydrolase [Chitinispirillia bacterium]|nr:family 20 glycosylhydrolase [Chitinispirillia bacterium]